jgi:polyhydroxyalkanoate synthesis regulator phasin
MDNNTRQAADKAAADAAALGQGAASADGQSVADMKDMKLVVMDSAELATRAASLAANAGLDLRNATKELLQGGQAMLQGNKKQGKMSMILVAVAGSLMLLAGILFVFMSLRLQGRIAQLDEMVLAVGKRVVEMDASLELVGGAQEAIKNVLTKQTEMAAAQAKIDARLEEVIKNAQGVPEQTAKQVEARIQALSKQVAGLDARFAAQSAATNRMVGQVQSMQGALGDASAMKRDLEAMARQQRERQSSEAGRAAQEAAAARARENMVQYPRKSSDKP